MSTQLQLSAEKRAGAGKGTARALRRESKVPAVIYGDNKAPVLISLDDKTLNLTYLKGHMFTSLCTLDVAGEKHMVLTKAVQLDPVTDRVVHADFMRVTPKTIVKVMVPVQFANRETCKGMKTGGYLAIAHHEVELACPATDIPEFITVDVADLEIGDAVKLSDVKLPKGVKAAAQDASEVQIVVVHAPLVQAAEEAAPAAAAPAAAAPAAEKAPAKK